MALRKDSRAQCGEKFGNAAALFQAQDSGERNQKPGQRFTCKDLCQKLPVMGKIWRELTDQTCLTNYGTSQSPRTGGHEKLRRRLPTL